MKSKRPPASQRKHPLVIRSVALSKGSKGRDVVNKVESLVEAIALRIKEGDWKVEEKLPSRHQFAVEYDVSPGTVSTVMYRLQQRGMIYLVPNHGAFVGETAIAGAADLFQPPIGIRGSYIPTVLCEKGVLYYFDFIVRSIWRAAQHSHVPVMLLSSQTKGYQLTPQYCRAQGLKGIIFLGGDTYEEAVELRSAGIPTMLAYEPLEASPMNYVNYDYARAMQEMIGRFVALGHRRIAVIATASSVHSFYNKFRPTYIEALCEHGIEENLNRYWRFVEPDLVSDDPWYPAVDATFEMLAMPAPPTALFVFGPIAAKSIQAALKAAGKSISIVATNFHSEEKAEISGFFQNVDELGKQLLEGIHQAVANPLHFFQKRLPLQFVDCGTVYPVTSTL